MFDPSFSYTVQDPTTGVLHVLHGHQVGQLVIREFDAPFTKIDRNDIASVCDDRYGIEHWGLGVGVQTFQRFETALFIADALSMEMPDPPFETVDDFFAWLSRRFEWLTVTKLAGEAEGPMKSLREWRAERESDAAHG